MCKFQASIFLAEIILAVVVYLGEATAKRSGNGYFDRECQMSPTGKLIFLVTALISLV